MDSKLLTTIIYGKMTTVPGLNPMLSLVMDSFEHIDKLGCKLRAPGGETLVCDNEIILHGLEKVPHNDYNRIADIVWTQISMRIDITKIKVFGGCVVEDKFIFGVL